jgi:hypothetical protein
MTESQRKALKMLADSIQEDVDALAQIGEDYARDQGYTNHAIDTHKEAAYLYLSIIRTIADKQETQ